MILRTMPLNKSTREIISALLTACVHLARSPAHFSIDERGVPINIRLAMVSLGIEVPILSFDEAVELAPSWPFSAEQIFDGFGATDACQDIIPSVTDPRGRAWSQPDPAEILIDDEHAVMTLATFHRLAEYNCSSPSGVYPGKMWRVDNSKYWAGSVKAGRLHGLWLRWYGESSRPGMCSNHARKILIV